MRTLPDPKMIVFLVLSFILVCWCQMLESSPAVGVVGGVVNINMTISDRDINTNRNLKDPNNVTLLDFVYGKTDPAYTNTDVKYTGNISDGFVSFTLSNLRMQSAGIYQYFVSKPVNGNVVAGEQYLVIAESPSTPIISGLSQQAVAGREYKLNCSALSRSEKPGHNLTMFSEWKRNGVNIMADTKYGVNGTILTIRNLSRADNIVSLTCIAFEDQRVKSPESIAFSLNVYYGPDQIILSPSQMSYDRPENSSLNVNCSADCVPSCHYRWTGPGVNYPDNTGILSISKISRNQAGVITCTAYNPIITSNSATATVSVTVQYGPDHITLSPSQMAYDLPENSSLNVNCSADCVPSCQYRWTGPGGYYPNNTGVLSISKISRSQTGVMTCTAYNPIITSNSATATVSVTVQYGPDHITLSPSQMSYDLPENSSLNVNCSADCVPSCRYRWTGPSGNYPDNTGILSISKISRNQAGVITCTAYNPIITSNSATATVSVTVQYGPDHITLSPSQMAYDLPENSSLNVNCSADCVPSCQYRWTGPGVNYPDKTGILSISKISRNQAGVITCTAYNPIITSNSATATVSVTVQYPPVVSINSRNGTSNDTDIALNCSAHGVPEQYIFTLTHNSLFTGIKIRHPSFDFVSTSVISYRFSNFMDTGVYTCTVNNGIADDIDGSMNKSVSETVWIKGPPNVTSSNASFHAEKGQSGRLAIEFYNSLLDPNVTWYRGRNQSLEKLDSSDKYNISISNASVTLNFYSVSIQQPGFSAALEIRNVTPDDFGYYQVNVQNSVGVMSPRVLVLRPKGPPDVPHDVHILPSSITTSSVGVEWLSGFYGGFDQTFAIEYREHTDTIWTKSSEEVFGGMAQDEYFNITVGGLHQETMYLFRMYAWNSYNRSEYSVVINATTTADIKGEKILGNGSDKVIIGSAVGAVVLIGFAVVVGVVIFKRRRMEKLNADGLVDNPVYDSTEPPTSFMKNSSATGDEYAAVKKKKLNRKEDLSTGSLYAQVDKTNKTGKRGEIYENVELEGKNSNPENLYENSKSAKAKATVDNAYENPETAAHNGPLVNRDGLLYADLVLNPPTTRNGKPVIIGKENRTEYAEIAYSKRGEPLPDSDDEKNSGGPKEKIVQ